MRVRGIASLPASVVDQHAKTAKSINETKTVEDFRWEFADLALEIMKQDTNKAAAEDSHINISPLVDLVNEALDVLGVYGVYDDLFRQEIFADTLTKVAHSDKHNLPDFSAKFWNEAGREQPRIDYHGIPNDRPLYPIAKLDKEAVKAMWGLGGWWWLVHWVGATTADKLVREGSLFLYSVHDENHNSGPRQRLYDGSAFFKEYRSMMRSPNPDLMPMHAIHGFVWHYVALTRRGIREYPVELLHAFCGEHIDKKEHIKAVHNDAARECRHGFGHAIYYLMALDDMNVSAVDVRRQFRMGVGFELTPESRCLGYKICEQAPGVKAQKDCHHGYGHSRSMFSSGIKERELKEQYTKEKEECLAAQ